VQETHESYDAIVIGGGSSGCIAAAELAKDSGRRVLLLEYGERAEENPETLLADGYKDAFVNDRLIWDRFSIPQESCGGNRLFMGSGMGMGGSGSVNGMVYTRGCASDYAEWPKGWQWQDVSPSFEALERKLRVRRREPTRFTEACIRASEETGFRRKEDLNDGDLHGVLGYEWMNYEGDHRRSSYVAFLADGELPNLTVKTQARAHRLRFDDNRHVVGVEYGRKGARNFAASKQIVVCAGALETPRLLMLSGVGPADQLRNHGISPVFENPGVGSNFHDHPNITLFFAGRETVDSNYPQLYGFHRANYETDFNFQQPDTCYVFYPARSSLIQAAQRLVPGMVLPPALYDLPLCKGGVRAAIGLAGKQAWVQRLIEKIYGIVVILGKPKSRGVIRLRSANPEDATHIDPRYFDDPADMQTMLEGVRRALRISQANALKEWGSRRLAPAPWRNSKEALENWIRQNAMTTYHFAGTCRMGDDASSVVDSRLRLRGVQGVRIADASVIPHTPVSALNAPSMLVGLRAAQFIEEEKKDGCKYAAA
jgi:choline dehydrogenase